MPKDAAKSLIVHKEALTITIVRASSYSILNLFTLYARCPSLILLSILQS